MIAQKNTPNAVMRKRGAQLLPLSCLLASLPVLAAEQADKELPKAGETMVVTGTAMKVEVPMAETPRAVSVVNREELDQHAVLKLDESLRYRSGVLSQSYGSDTDADWFKVRGFDAASYLDGNRLFSTGYYVWTPEPFGLESVEVLKGPASILYGEAPPGGVINAISKRPTATPQGLVNLQLGNRDLRQVGVDVSDTLTDNSRYRLVALYNERDGVLDGTYNERAYLAPSVTLDISDRTTLTLLSSFKHDEGVPTNGFFPVYGTLNTSGGQIDPSTNLSQPDYDRNRNTQISAGYELAHQLNQTWEFKQNVRFNYNDLLLRQTYIFPTYEGTTAYRGLVYRDGDTKSATMDNQMVGYWNTDSTEQTLLLGVDLQRHVNEGQESDNYGMGAINTMNPDYSGFPGFDESTATHQKSTKGQSGLYAQHQIRWDDRWLLTAGGRFDYVETHNISEAKSKNEKQYDDNLSLSGSLMYLADNGLSPYFAYAESFEVLPGIDPNTGNSYKPLEGKLYETGVKYAPSFLDGYINLALFDLEQTNSLVSTGSGQQTQAGEVTSQGVELEGSVQATEALRLTAAYTYTDAKTNDTGNGDRRASLIPRHQASFWGNYKVQQGPVSGLELGSGVRYVGSSVGIGAVNADYTPIYGSAQVPAHTVWDAMIGYDFAKNWRAQINVNNLLNDTYVASCDYYCYYGEPRSIVGTVNYRW
ncbi:TonB-dependent siderophore receptor [Aeromonas caviae]|uniref:TonB-dependent siderophore receptor n=1 Tax=Aeromonas caviae TaxID=648 RepID=UPI001CC79D39|nr:TonB-dependent siderophore receptor [Aeromonas caviae]MCY9813622.1 TonB-dependent siderophore receptor [Aeromonas caviae]MDH0026459.1 TonB-dependent siderophore receptor [Aeromonas caviae]MDH0359140.1 TonB-dependent siderophore receptor [Aeromonas caviae]MDH1078246.1 TonB-dependent siderophore receptor [Aeromonas caviae]GJA09511.1 ligand-gated channel [Aeromonas caviae]